ncbi:hypothetical protein [Gordonia amicalis]|uniref:hypothetical protein n=1 Tax=Gordonia amicalis TaxID=89053 RepID=UPI0024BBBD09|nr:hypothetical protein [Gordonia amicalis]MDJ0451502.1 hypothetical protein [Gordonia amicalis]MDV7076412.1 hypothetical protein [Gordonia amicalis]
MKKPLINTWWLVAAFIVTAILGIYVDLLFIFPSAIIAVWLLLRGLAPHPGKAQEMFDKDIATAKAQGATDGEALLYAQGEKRRRDAWVQAAGQM